MIPAGWHLGPLADASAAVKFTLMLRQRNLEVLDRWFYEAADPTHAHYQHFRSIDEISSLVSPAESELTAVHDWLHLAGVQPDHIKWFGDAIEVSTTVRHAVRLFETKFHVFEHKDSGITLVRQLGSYSVPSDLSIEMVFALSSFLLPRRTPVRRATRRTAASLDYGVVPQTVAAMYNILPSSARTGRGDSFATSVGVFQHGESYTPDDLAWFGGNCSETIPSLSPDHIIGANDPANPGPEATLDIELLAGVNPETELWFWRECHHVALHLRHPFLQHQRRATSDVRVVRVARE